MAKLFDITAEYAELLDRINAAAEENEGEVPQELLDEVIGKDTAFEEKAETIAKAIKNYESDAKAYAEAEKTFAAKKKRATNSVTYLKELLKSCMLIIGKDKIKTPLFNVSTRTSTAVVVEDENSIPDGYFRVRRELAKDEIMKALEGGFIVNGARLGKNTNIQIR